ncbi:MAG: SDR family oxidoreductase [Gammaproteobacteria bacterium]|nr:SDR family oxidoreductase [Gammaproteobacteria bacterium]
MNVSIVTGSNSGIGYATALHLARNGFKVYATMRTPDKGTAIREAAALEQLPLEIMQLDCTDNASMESAIAAVLDAEEHIDVLVNNAGIGGGAPLEFVQEKELRAIMETNFFGAYKLMQLVIPGMRTRGSGAIVNITSVAGFFGNPSQSAYNASKFALEGASHALAGEVGQHGIRVACVEPGVVATPIFDKAPDASAFMQPPFPYHNNVRRLMALFESGLKNPATPQDVADAVYEAITSDDPKQQYRVGEDARALWEAQRTVPIEEFTRMNGLEDDQAYFDTLRTFGLDVQT